MKYLETMDDVQDFAKKIEIKPYEEVKKNLDRIAAQTAKDSAAGLVKRFEKLGASQ